MMNPEFVEEDRELHNFVEDIFRKHRPLGFATKTDVVGIPRTLSSRDLIKTDDDVKTFFFPPFLCFFLFLVEVSSRACTKRRLLRG